MKKDNKIDPVKAVTGGIIAIGACAGAVLLGGFLAPALITGVIIVSMLDNRN